MQVFPAGVPVSIPAECPLEREFDNVFLSCLRIWYPRFPDASWATVQISQLYSKQPPQPMSTIQDMSRNARFTGVIVAHETHPFLLFQASGYSFFLELDAKIISVGPEMTSSPASDETNPPPRPSSLDAIINYVRTSEALDRAKLLKMLTDLRDAVQ